MKENPIRDLLAQGNWGEDQALLQGLRQWQYAPVLWQAYETLQEEALFHSQRSEEHTSELQSPC